MQIVIASKNIPKIQECRSMLKTISWLDVLSLNDFPDYEPPEETGATFEENALIKAQHAAATFLITAIADDSGLIVPFLKGSPGVFSRRYAGQRATDGENNKKLLEALEGQEEMQRTAYYECCLGLATPLGETKSFTGRCEGMILKQGRGSNGFGYDPLFVKNDYEKSFGEITAEIKNKISHRAKAFEKLAIYLENHRASLPET